MRRLPVVLCALLVGCVPASRLAKLERQIEALRAPPPAPLELPRLGGDYASEPIASIGTWVPVHAAKDYMLAGLPAVGAGSLAPVTIGGTETITGAKTFSATASFAGITATTASFSGTITSTVASGSIALQLVFGAKLHFGNATRAYLYQCQNGQDEVCAAQSFRVGGAITAGTLTIGTGANISFEGVSGFYGSYTDSTASPGAATINRSFGKSAVANGASSVVITSSVATATAMVHITPLSTNNADNACRGYYVTPASGSFTVTCPGGNTGAAWSFSWFIINGQ